MLDRCLVRVRMTRPWDTLDGTPVTTTGTEAGVHPDYRVNGGRQITVENYAIVADAAASFQMFAPLIFGATLVPGPNHLEVGSCDSVDVCKWSAVDLSVTLGPGSPDPAFGEGGQKGLVEPDAAYHLLPLADGRALVSVNRVVAGLQQIGLVRLGSDGVIDVRFGDRGFAALASFPGEPFIASLATGGYLVLTRGLANQYGASAGGTGGAGGTQSGAGGGTAPGTPTAPSGGNNTPR